MFKILFFLLPSRCDFPTKLLCKKSFCEAVSGGTPLSLFFCFSFLFFSFFFQLFFFLFFFRFLFFLSFCFAGFFFFVFGFFGRSAAQPIRRSGAQALRRSTAQAFSRSAVQALRRSGAQTLNRSSVQPLSRSGSQASRRSNHKPPATAHLVDDSSCTQCMHETGTKHTIDTDKQFSIKLLCGSLVFVR